MITITTITLAAIMLKVALVIALAVEGIAAY
jgi:hypothetical protein